MTQCQMCVILRWSELRVELKTVYTNGNLDTDVNSIL